MQSWLDTKYINLLSPRLDRFKRSNGGYNFRCPICGDSKKSKTKTRGWIFNKDGAVRFYCHNCNASMKFPYFLKTVDLNLYYEYVKDSMLDKQTDETDLQQFVNKMKKPEFVKTTKIGDLKKISQLAPEHFAKRYVMGRQIPTNKHHKLFFAPKFKQWVNSIIPDKFPSTKYDESRLIIPFLDEEGKLFGFQGRSFKSNDDFKYITIMIDDEKPKLFGMDDLDHDRTVYVFEGPLDAMFIDNSIASCGGLLDTNISALPVDKENFVNVYDNEPRAQKTIKKIEKSIDNGYHVCIWPDNVKEKDVNDMILNGCMSHEVQKIIDKNTYHGLAATMRLSEWKKI